LWIPTSYSCALVLLSSGAVAIAICNALPVLWNDVMFAQWPYRRRENCAYAGSQSDESIGGCTDFDSAAYTQTGQPEGSIGVTAPGAESDIYDCFLYVVCITSDKCAVGRCSIQHRVTNRIIPAVSLCRSQQLDPLLFAVSMASFHCSTFIDPSRCHGRTCLVLSARNTRLFIIFTEIGSSFVSF